MNPKNILKINKKQSKFNKVLYYYDRSFTSHITGGCELNQFVICHTSQVSGNTTENKLTLVKKISVTFSLTSEQYFLPITHHIKP